MNKKGWFGYVVAYSLLGIFILLVMSLLGVGGGYFNLGIKTVSAKNFEKNYEYFKLQESSMTQIKTQICQSKAEIDEFGVVYGNDATKWNKEIMQQRADLVYIKNGYISKYNAMAAEYNAKRSSFIQNFGRDSNTPREYAEFYEADCGAVQ